MAKIIFPSEKNISGPWLVEEKHLLELHSIFEEIDAELLQSHKNSLEKEIIKDNDDVSEDELEKKVSEKLSNSFRTPHSKYCVIETNDGTKIEDQSIRAILKNQSLRNTKAKSIKIYLSYGRWRENDFELVIPYSDNDLKYRIDCKDNNISEEIFYKVENWAKQFEQNIFVKYWTKIGEFIPFIIWMPLVLLGLLSFGSTYSSYDTVVNQEIKRLIETGIDSTNSTKAIELILKTQIDYEPEDFEPKKIDKDPIYGRFFYLTVFILIISIFRPRTTIGLGKSRKLVEYQKIWIKIITVILPTSLILAPFWEYLKVIIYN